MASELTKPFEEKMKKTLTALDSDYGTIRAGRANPHVLYKIMVSLVCCRFSLGMRPC